MGLNQQFTSHLLPLVTLLSEDKAFHLECLSHGHSKCKANRATCLSHFLVSFFFCVAKVKHPRLLIISEENFTVHIASAIIIPFFVWLSPSREVFAVHIALVIFFSG